MDSQGTVEVFRAVTTRERVVKNEEKILTKTMRKMYSPKERIKCAYLSAGGEYVFLVFYPACSSRQHSFDVFPTRDYF